MEKELKGKKAINVPANFFDPNFLIAGVPSSGYEGNVVVCPCVNQPYSRQGSYCLAYVRQVHNCTAIKSDQSWLTQSGTHTSSIACLASQVGCLFLHADVHPPCKYNLHLDLLDCMCDRLKGGSHVRTMPACFTWMRHRTSVGVHSILIFCWDHMLRMSPIYKIMDIHNPQQPPLGVCCIAAT
jgi:hypothetical protein